VLRRAGGWPTCAASRHLILPPSEGKKLLARRPASSMRGATFSEVVGQNQGQTRDSHSQDLTSTDTDVWFSLQWKIRVHRYCDQYNLYAAIDQGIKYLGQSVYAVCVQ